MMGLCSDRQERDGGRVRWQLNVVRDRRLRLEDNENAEIGDSIRQRLEFGHVLPTGSRLTLLTDTWRS